MRRRPNPRVVNPDLLHYCWTCKEKKQYGEYYDYQHCSLDSVHERFECAQCKAAREAREKKEAEELAEKRKVDPDYGIIKLPPGLLKTWEQKPLRYEWGCTRVHGHAGEHLTAGLPIGIQLVNGCKAWGARWVEKDEERPDDLYEHGKSKPKVKIRDVAAESLARMANSPLFNSSVPLETKPARVHYDGSSLLKALYAPPEPETPLEKTTLTPITKKEIK